MPPLTYHHGQLSIQAEAKTTAVAEHLAVWVGPVTEFARGADLVLLAAPDEGQRLRFTVLSGQAPLLEVAVQDDTLVRFPSEFSSRLPIGRCGGLVINLALARRARLNGVIAANDGVRELAAKETFTLCRKYMAPSIALEAIARLGPDSRRFLPPDDPWLRDLLARAETSFLASISPDGGPDVAHRGGPPGFLTLDPANGRLSWPEYVGDGVFKSAGNVRATGAFTLLVPDLDSGDGVELVGEGKYTNLRPERKMRVDALVQHKEPFPVQGVIESRVHAAYRLTGVLSPRRRIDKALKITSCSAIDEQAPR
jgi:uncharacterized protein